MEKQQATNQVPEKKSVLRVVIHSFFVVPLIIAIFSVIIFLVVRIITSEPNTAQDYLEDVKIGGSTKRWQGAFELSKILSNPKMIPKDDRFILEMISSFEYASNDRDSRVRQYLALAMGATKDSRYVPTLLASLDSSEPEMIMASIHALGNIGDNAAVQSIINILDHGEAKVRLQAVISLGKIGDKSSISNLKEMMADSEVNVRWDAAIALAKLGDPSGQRILLDLLDRNYLDSFPNIDEIEQVQAMMVAIQVAPFIQDLELKTSLVHLKQNDPNLKIREAARKTLTQFE
ncbi:MAG: HEAT repeat domain-containing protein [Candidatus Marinimicrobia bacterium]|nr:HEAT repeat domain-containing protein [Candidatus Neomarinimicrobiota bacterium]